jgi:hypothetical protein
VGGTIAAHFSPPRWRVKASRPGTPTTSAGRSSTSASARPTELGEDDPDVLREQSREALRAYLTELASRVRPVSVERRFELRFDGAEWSIVGYLDVEDESGDTIDVKVGAKHVTRSPRGARPAADDLPAGAPRGGAPAGELPVPLGKARADAIR